jgi:hypothetical protein
MASNAWWAYGSEFQIATTKVGEIIDINGPSMSKDAIDVTYGDGTVGDGYKSFIPGWRDGGEVNITANWIPADSTQDGTTGLLSVFASDALQAFKIVTAEDGSSGTMDISFSGIITRFNVDMPLTEQGKLDCTVKISGAVTIS